MESNFRITVFFQKFQFRDEITVRSSDKVYGRVESLVGEGKIADKSQEQLRSRTLDPDWHRIWIVCRYSAGYPEPG